MHFCKMEIGFKSAAEDLEFDKIKAYLSEYCNTASAVERVQKLNVLKRKNKLMSELNCVDEMLKSFSGIPIPSIQAEEILSELKLLGIENTILEEESFMNIRALSVGINKLIRFHIKSEDLYPHLIELTKEVYITEEINLSVQKVLDGKGIVKSSASEALMQIRSKLNGMRKQGEKLFVQDLNRYKNQGWLDSQVESFVQDRRVLAVLAEYKRQVNGQMLGSSQSGRIAYIEPSATNRINNEINTLIQEERIEIRRILKVLTDQLREFKPLLKAYQKLLVDMDFIRAKAKFAEELGAQKPGFSPKRHVVLNEAYHPILLIENKKMGLPVKPITLRINKKKRILVISGPNAGGKSISLKTVGLLQIMYQCGLLIPVGDDSQMTVFEHILTDIGDNQSIENQLSTYSYRLQTMRKFLDVAGERSLFLIDEFGTGSDPELGGALAEVFFEELYKVGSFGVLTTHYTNIKIKADELDETVNGSMLFDRNTLEPLYELSVGQPGSSFTFEVAEKNGIHSKLIGKAKTLVKGGKIKLDHSIAQLQKQKAKIKQLEEKLEQTIARQEKSETYFDVRREEFEEKIIRQQVLQEQHNKQISLGRKMQELLNQYNGKNQKKVLASFEKIMKVEHVNKIESKKKKSTAPTPKLAPVELKKQEIEAKIEKKKSWQMPKVGQKVVVEGSTMPAEVESINGNEATIIVGGNIRTKISVKKLWKK